LALQAGRHRDGDGRAGYIGSIVVRLLLDAGRKVRNVDALLYGDDAIRDILDHPNLELVVADFRDATRTRQALRGADAVIHLGAIVGDPACAIDEDQSLSTNVHRPSCSPISASSSACRDSFSPPPAASTAPATTPGTRIRP